MNKQRISWILALIMGVAAAALALRRREQIPGGPSFSPMPEPPEPPRIVLPQSVLQEEQTGGEREPHVEVPAEEPLQERAVGGFASSAAAPAKQTQSETSAQHDEHDSNAKTGYCVRCRTKRPIAEAEEVTTEHGRRALSGSCPECGTRIFRFLPGKAHD